MQNTLTEPQKQMRITDLLVITMTNVVLNKSVMRHTASEVIWEFSNSGAEAGAHVALNTAQTLRVRHDTYLAVCPRFILRRFVNSKIYRRINDSEEAIFKMLSKKPSQTFMAPL
jgi:hypothetical protein